MVREGGSRVDPRWRSGRSPATPDRLFRGERYPTLSHSATQLSSFVPQTLSVVRSRTRFPCKSCGFLGGWGEDPNAARCAQDGVQDDRVAPRIAVRWWPSLRSSDAPTRILTLPCLLLIAVAARRLRRRRRRRRRRSREGGPGRHGHLLRGRRAPRGRPARRRARRRRQGAAHRRPGGEDPRAASTRRSRSPTTRTRATRRTSSPGSARRPACGSPASTATSRATSRSSRPRTPRRRRRRSTRASRTRAARSSSAPTRASTTRSTRTAWRPASSATSSPSAPSAEFKRTVKANDGDSLADDKSYKDTVDELDDDRLGLFYIDLKPFFEQAIKADPSAAAAVPAAALDLPGRQARAARRRAARRRRPDRVRHAHERPRAWARCACSPRSWAPARRRWSPSCLATPGPRTARRTSAPG